MSKSAKAKIANKDEKIVCPSRFGSHKSMIDKEATKKIFGFEEVNYESEKERKEKAKKDKKVFRPDRRTKEVVLKDEYGLYITERRKLDNGLTDLDRSSNEEPRERVEKALKEKPIQKKITMIKFKEDTELTVVEGYDEANDEITEQVTETFKEGELVEADIISENEKHVDLQFGDGSIALTVLRDSFEAVEDNS